jgi:GNAT superfamily N-acetyltransferase
MSAQEPVLLLPGQRAAAVEVLVQAFADDIVYRWIFRDRGDRLRSLRHHIDAIVHYSLVRGEVYTTPELSGVACWVPPRDDARDLWAFFRSGCGLLWSTLVLEPGARRRMMTMISHDHRVACQVMHGPYWYLTLLGVEPSLQGRGIGGALLQPRLRACDRAGLPCYLETETPSNVRFYERHGFAVAHEGRIPDGGPPMWAMRREPSRT